LPVSQPLSTEPKVMKQVLKNIYRNIPYKKNIFQALRGLNPSRNLYQHLHFEDWIDVTVDEKSFKIYHYGYQVENDIFWSGIRGNWEKQSLDLWIRLCKHSKTILDVGANTGVYSLVAGTVNEDAQIFAFEPSKHVAEKLRRNVAANPFNISVVQVAASNESGVATFNDTDEHNYTGSLNPVHGQNTKTYQVEVKTLDQFVEENGLQVDLLKIDVEKHEPEVMGGFQKYLKLHQPSILMEILDEEVGNRVQELVDGIPYLYFNLHEKGTIRQVDRLTKSDDYNYLICTADVAKKIDILS
jgi:FkbM family methyltransferase